MYDCMKLMPEIERLAALYEHRWGTPVDHTIRPAEFDQTKLVAVLERIVDTGESVLAGYNKIFLSNN